MTAQNRQTTQSVATSSSAAPPHGMLVPIWELVVHVIVGSLLFAIIFAPAVFLDWGISELKEEKKVSDSLATILTWTKYIVAWIDAFLYLAFMIKMGWVFLRKLYIN